jgi:hypothetical protein
VSVVTIASGYRLLLARLKHLLGLDKRQHPRIYGRPLKLQIDGRRYEAADWSYSGMRITGYKAPLRPRDSIAGTILATGHVKRGDFVAEVVRVMPDGSVGVRFIKLWSETLVSMGRGAA